MKTRPWPIVILALFHILAPLGNAFWSAWLTSKTPWAYTADLWRGGTWFMQFVTWGLMPTAGIAIYMMKRWSYYVFLAAMSVLIYSNYVAWKIDPATMPLTAMLAGSLVNVALVTYFLLPMVRAGFLNARLRWWESLPRYELNLGGMVSHAKATTKCTVVDISEGGVFVACPARLKAGDRISVEFELLGRSMRQEGKVVYARMTGARGYGVEFIHDSESRQELRQVIKGLKLIAPRARWSKANHWKEFSRWAERLARTGAGWQPEFPPRYLEPKVPELAVTRIEPHQKRRQSRARKTVRKAA